jgi:hypothetical protein
MAQSAITELAGGSPSTGSGQAGSKQPAGGSGQKTEDRGKNFELRIANWKL